jgi:hypothetical protein
VTVILVASGWAAVPHLINYQGRLTNIAGQPVPDGPHSVSFVLYPDSVSGAPLWSETTDVVTEDGLFSYLLGSQSVLESSLFTDNQDLYLLVVYNGQNLTPRTRLVAAPFTLLAEDIEKRNDDDSVAIATGLGPQGGGALHLYSSVADSGTTVSLSPDYQGDSAVILPENSINSEELLNEPGFVYNFNTQPVELVEDHIQDLVTVTIEAPTEGYVLLDGKCYVVLDGTTGPNQALIQIDDEEGGTSSFPYYQLAGLNGYVDSGENYFPVYVTRIYYVEAGEYTFRMEGRAEQPLPARARSWDHVVRAIFMPTTYWPQSGVVGLGSLPSNGEVITSPHPRFPDSVRTADKADIAPPINR